MPGESKFDGKGQRRFIRNMAAAGALGASSGSAGAAIATRGRAKFRPIKTGAIGGLGGGAAGAGMVAHHRRSKMKKNLAVSAFGIDHGQK